MNTAGERTQALLDSHAADRDLQWLMHQQKMRAFALRAAITRRAKGHGLTMAFDQHVESYVKFIMNGDPING